MILFSTHRFDMVEKVCSRAVILSKGKLAAEHCVSSARIGDSDSLEELFVRVTNRPTSRRSRAKSSTSSSTHEPAVP